MRKSLFLGLAMLLAGCGQGPSATPPLAGARIGGPFALTDQDGRAVTERSFAGRYLIVYFGYTFCPDACPTDMAAIGTGLKQVAATDPARAAKVTPVFITVDPARDTSPVLKAFVAAFHPRAVGLTGSQTAIDMVAKEYGVAHSLGPKAADGGYLVDHSRAAYLMSPDGQPIALAGADGGPAEVARTIERWVPCRHAAGHCRWSGSTAHSGSSCATAAANAASTSWRMRTPASCTPPTSPAACSTAAPAPAPTTSTAAPMCRNACG